MDSQKLDTLIASVQRVATEQQTMAIELVDMLGVLTDLREAVPVGVLQSAAPAVEAVHMTGPAPGLQLAYDSLKSYHQALLLGLADTLQMIRLGDDNRATADATLTAVAARLAGMLGAHQTADDNRA